jgi:hypothetical protein
VVTVVTDAWALFDRLADRYDQVIPFFAGFGTQLVDLVAPVPGSRLLDIGSGRGAVATAAAARGCVVTALDAAPRMVSLLAAAHPGIDVRVMGVNRPVLGPLTSVGFVLAYPPRAARSDPALHGRAAGRTTREPHRPITEFLRVLSRSSRSCRGLAARRAALQAGLKRLEVDVVAFQEVICSDDYDQARDLLGPEYRIVNQSVGLVDDGMGGGAAVASRLPIAAVHEADLHVGPRTTDYACVAMAVEVREPR